MNATSFFSRGSATTVCRACRLSLPRRQRFSSTGRIFAAAPYQAYPLPPPQGPEPSAPPRDASVPESSIARPLRDPLPRVHETRPPPVPGTSATPTRPAPARPQSRLRTPRKAALRFTPAAVEQIAALLDGPRAAAAACGVRNRGCSGLAYNLELVSAPGAFDEVVEQDGVSVLVDSKALFSIIGSEMDWVEDKLSQRFVFRNPNISECLFVSVCLPRVLCPLIQLTAGEREINADAASRLWFETSPSVRGTKRVRSLRTRYERRG